MKKPLYPTRKAFNLILLLIVTITLLTLTSCKKEEVKRPAIQSWEIFEANTEYEALYNTALWVQGIGEYEIVINNQSYQKGNCTYEGFITDIIIFEDDIYKVVTNTQNKLQRIEQY